MVESFIHLKKPNKIEEELRDILENRFYTHRTVLIHDSALKEEMIQLYQMEDREHFVKEFKEVILLRGSVESKTSQLQILAIAKEKNLDVGIHDVLVWNRQ